MTPWSVGDLLPGLVVAAGAGALTWTAARFYDRVPALVVAAFALVVAVGFGRVLAGGEVLVPVDLSRGRPPFVGLAAADPPGNPLQGDLVQLILPAQAEVRRALSAGRWPLRSARTGTGMPLLADPQAQALEPLTLATLTLSLVQAPGATAALRVYLALLFTFLFLSRLGLAVPAALAGALAWGLGGFLLLWLGWPLANSAALLPALLYALARVADRGGHRDGALAAACAWALLLGGHPETVLYALALGAAFFAARLAAPRPPEAPSRRRVLGAAAAALGIGLGAAAPALLPAAAYFPQSLRAANLMGPRPEPAAPEALRRAALRLVPVAAPNAFGNDRYGAYWGGANVNEDAAGFVGTAALVLVLASALRRGGRRPQERLFLAVAAGGLVVVAQAPGLVWALARLPGGAVSDYHHRLLLLVGFGLAVATACELDRRARGQGRLWPVASGALALAAFHAWAYLAFRHPEDPGRLEVLRWGSLLWHLRVLLAAATLLALLGMAQREPRGLRESAFPQGAWRHRLDWAAYGLPVLGAVELLVLLGPASPPAPRHLAFPETPPLAFLREHVGGDRVAGLDLALHPNLGAVYGLADARVYSPMAPAAYAAATRAVTLGWSGEVPHWGRPEHPLYDLLGVRYVLAPAEAEPPPPLVKVFEHPAGAVWQRSRPLPLLFLPAAAEAQGPDWPERLARISDFSALATAGDLPAGAWRASRPELGTVRLERQGSAHLRATFSAPEPRLLATSVYQDGGWRLLVDGRRQPTTRADGPFLGAWLPAGEHRLDLVYRPPGFLAGCLAAALAVGAALAAVRPRAPAPPPAPGPSPLPGAARA